MSALDDARAVLRAQPDGFYDPTLAALVAECESERAQLGELLVRAVEACEEQGDGWPLTLVPDLPGGGWRAVTGRNHEKNYQGRTLRDALRALLAKVEPPAVTP